MKNCILLTLRPASLLCKFIIVRAFAEPLLFNRFIFFGFLYNPWCSKLNTFEFKSFWLILAWKLDFFFSFVVICNFLHIFGMLKELKFKYTCNSCISFSCTLELKISLLIISWSSSKSSGLNGLLLLLLFEFSLVSFTSSASSFSSIFGYFNGIETRPRAPRLRSFSRMSMNVCENLN